MSDSTKNAERIERLWQEVRACSTVYVFITTAMGVNGSKSVRACKLFRYGTSPERVGLMLEGTCPSGRTTMEQFGTTKYRESPIPILLFGNGFFDEDTRAKVDIHWPMNFADEPEPLYFEGELLANGDNYGRFVNLEDARTKSEFDLKFAHKGMSLRALLHVTDCDGRLPVWLLPELSRVFPPMVEIDRATLDSLRNVFPNRLFISAGYTDRSTISAIPIELPPKWVHSERPRVKGVNAKLFDIVEIVRERPLFIPDADDLEDEVAAEARLKSPADHGVELDGSKSELNGDAGVAKSETSTNGNGAHVHTDSGAPAVSSGSPAS